jgi:hypothetical protein
MDAEVVQIIATSPRISYTHQFAVGADGSHRFAAVKSVPCNMHSTSMPRGSSGLKFVPTKSGVIDFHVSDKHKA